MVRIKTDSGFSRIWAHIYKHHLMMIRSSSELSWLFVFPFISLLSIGIFAVFISNEANTSGLVLYILAGIISWNFYDLTQRAITYGFTYDFWSNSLKHSMVTASDEKDFIIGNSIYGLATSFFVLVLVGAVSIFAFGANIFSAGHVLIISVIPVFFFAIAIGLLINSMMVMKGHNWMSLIWSISGIIMIFSGVFYPVSILPYPLNLVSIALPSTYSIDALRIALGFEGVMNIYNNAITGILLSLFYLAASVVIFRKSVKKSKVSGKITQY